MTVPVADKQHDAVVVVHRLTDYHPDKVADAVAQQFALAGGLGAFVSRGDSVLIKPNFIVPRPRQFAAQTDPAVIVATAALLKDFGAKPFVADSPAWGSVAACAKALELDEPLRRLGVPVRPLDRPRRRRIDGTLISISRVAMDADKIINLPKFKSHQQLGASFAIKNMFGCVCGKRKAFWHWARGHSFDAFCTMLIEIYKVVAPVYSIIDGVVAMQGQGPISGNARPLGFLIGGADPVACEIVCCDLIGLAPDQLPILRTARHSGFGCSDIGRIEIRGDDYADSRCVDFQFAEQTPLNFPFSHVCRSVLKQFAFRAKCLLSKRSV
ncbi:MAG: DUF362 domain-containing protein [Phycisphaerae bacterium]|nr:DUF362 domain-containing protein [Phycisphaerae bacterium]